MKKGQIWEKGKAKVRGQYYQVEFDLNDQNREIYVRGDMWYHIW